jgi:transcription antitermination protein NusB
MATRHLCRTIVLQSLYEWDFYKQDIELDFIVDRNIQSFGADIDEPEFIWKIVTGVISHREEIDSIIEKAAPEWPLGQIAVVDRNILRMGLYELLYANKEEVPHKVAINESIELAKNFGGQNSSKFVNGVLGTVYSEIKDNDNNDTSTKKPQKT